MIDIHPKFPHNKIMLLSQKVHAGFTIVEMSIVATLIVLLGLLMLTALNPIAQIFKGYDAVRKADLSKIKNAFEAYYADHDCYPPASILNGCGTAALAPYMTSIPCDPNNRAPYKVYTVPEGSSCPQQYAIYAPIISFFDPQKNNIPNCPNTFAVYSSDMLTTTLTGGCSGIRDCAIVYGCKSGVCQVVAQDVAPTCSPNSCLSDCGGDCNIPRMECESF